MKTVPITRILDGANFGSIRAAVRAYYVDTVPTYNVLARAYQELSYAILSGKEWHGSRYKRVYGSGTNRRRKLDDIREMCRLGMKQVMQPMADPNQIATELIQNLGRLVLAEAGVEA